MREVSLGDFLGSVPFKKKIVPIYYRSSRICIPKYLLGIIKKSGKLDGAEKKRIFSCWILCYQMADGDKTLSEELFELMLLEKAGVLLFSPKLLKKTKLPQKEHFVFRADNGRELAFSPVWCSVYCECFGYKELKSLIKRCVNDVDNEFRIYLYKNNAKKIYPSKSSIKKGVTARIVLSLLRDESKSQVIEI